MATKSDRFARLTASRVCALTGVRPQTRDTWVNRGLLRSAMTYGELDVIEQAVVKALLATLPKSHVDFVWHEARPCLRGRVITAATDLVWDPQVRRVSVTTAASKLRAAVRHGRPVHVIPLGELVVGARAVYRAEVEAAARAEAARSTARRKGSADLATRDGSS
jgi:hypothetical protein